MARQNHVRGVKRGDADAPEEDSQRRSYQPGMARDDGLLDDKTQRLIAASKKPQYDEYDADRSGNVDAEEWKRGQQRKFGEEASVRRNVWR